MILQPSVERRQLEDLWREKVEEARRRYIAALELCRKLLEGMPDGTPPDPNGATARARQVQAETLAEYTRVLRVFTELTVHGQTPGGPSDAGSDYRRR